MESILYEVEYTDGQRTVVTDLTDVVLLVKDTYMSATVNCWFQGNLVSSMTINAKNRKGEKPK